MRHAGRSPVPPVVSPAGAPAAGRTSLACLEALLDADVDRARELLGEAKSLGLPRIYLEILEPALREVGRRWECGELRVAEEHVVTAATQVLMSELFAELGVPVRRRASSLLCACVTGELHQIGARMVADLCELDGWRTIFVGADTPTDDLLGLMSRHRPSVLALSLSRSCRLPAASEVIQRVRANARHGAIPILVGGLPFRQDPDLATVLGADGTARDAREAVALANRLAGEKPA